MSNNMLSINDCDECRKKQTNQFASNHANKKKKKRKTDLTGVSLNLRLDSDADISGGSTDPKERPASHRVQTPST